MIGWPCQSVGVAKLRIWKRATRRSCTPRCIASRRNATAVPVFSVPRPGRSTMSALQRSLAFQSEPVSPRYRLRSTDVGDEVLALRLRLGLGYRDRARHGNRAARLRCRGGAGRVGISAKRRNLAVRFRGRRPSFSRPRHPGFLGFFGKSGRDPPRRWKCSGQLFRKQFPETSIPESTISPEFPETHTCSPRRVH